LNLQLKYTISESRCQYPYKNKSAFLLLGVLTLSFQRFTISIVRQKEGDGKMTAIREKIKGTITMGEQEGAPVVRIFLSAEQKRKLLLESGKQPDNFIKVIIL
jgi:hypothetical protein